MGRSAVSELIVLYRMLAVRPDQFIVNILFAIPTEQRVKSEELPLILVANLVEQEQIRVGWQEKAGNDLSRDKRQ